MFVDLASAVNENGANSSLTDVAAALLAEPSNEEPVKTNTFAGVFVCATGLD